MRYIVITRNPLTGVQQAFSSEWFETENHYNPDYDMIVIDRARNEITFDGITWEEIEEDHL